jgi:hypothetical protein
MECPNMGTNRLFPDEHSAALGKRVGRYLRTTAKIKDPRKVLYSARHRFRACLREAMVSEEVADALMGHAGGGGTGRGYGAEAYRLPPLIEAVNKINMPV